VYIITPRNEKSAGLLDSGRFMTNAQNLYRLAGFIEIEEYPESEIPSELRHLWIFMEKTIP